MIYLLFAFTSADILILIILGLVICVLVIGIVKFHFENMNVRYVNIKPRPGRSVESIQSESDKRIERLIVQEAEELFKLWKENSKQELSYTPLFYYIENYRPLKSKWTEKTIEHFRLQVFDELVSSDVISQIKI